MNITNNHYTSVGLGEYDSPKKLKAFLNKLFESRELPIHEGVIARSKLEKKYSFTKTSLSNYHNSPKWEWAKEVVDKFEADLLEKEGGVLDGLVYEYGSPLRLKKLLELLRKKNDFPVYIGKISRKKFEKMYGFPTGSLVQRSQQSRWKWARDILDEFEIELYDAGVIGTKWEQKVPDIREHLNNLDKKKTLPVNEYGKLNRMKIMSQFGLENNQSTNIAEKRAPKLKQLFVEFDQRIKDGNYSQYSGVVYEDKLKDVLKRGDILLAVNQRIISKKWLAEKVGLSISKLYNTPSLMALIDAKHKEIHKAQRRGKTKKSFNLYGAATINLGATP